MLSDVYQVPLLRDSYEIVLMKIALAFHRLSKLSKNTLNTSTKSAANRHVVDAWLRVCWLEDVIV